MPEMDVVLAKINIIKNCLMAIERAAREEQDPFFKLQLFELNLQRGVQACIDLAHVVIAKEGLGLPTTYKQAFEILERHHALTPATAKVMKSMTGFRNISIHDYQEVDPKIVESIVAHHLKDFDAYAAEILERARAWADLQD
jgi:uncharacterized protein YutE (UPF0331/DUF86 family)